MKTLELNGEPRQEVGKKATKKVRKNAMVPCVLYGLNEPLHFNLVEKELGLLIYTPHSFIVNLTVGNKKCQALLKDIQFHPVSDAILHADFVEVDANKAVIVKLPVQLQGFARGVQQGGKLKAEMRKLTVKGLIKDFPDHIDINVTKLGVGQSIKVRELSLDSLQILDPKNAVVASVKLTRAAKGAAAAATEDIDEQEESGEESGEE